MKKKILIWTPIFMIVVALIYAVYWFVIECTRDLLLLKILGSVLGCFGLWWWLIWATDKLDVKEEKR